MQKNYRERSLRIHQIDESLIENLSLIINDKWNQLARCLPQRNGGQCFIEQDLKLVEGSKFKLIKKFISLQLYKKVYFIYLTSNIIIKLTCKNNNLNTRNCSIQIKYNNYLINSFSTPQRAVH